MILLFNPFEKAYVKPHTRKGKHIEGYFTKRAPAKVEAKHLKKRFLDHDAKSADKAHKELEEKKRKHQIILQSLQNHHEKIRKEGHKDSSGLAHHEKLSHIQQEIENQKTHIENASRKQDLIKNRYKILKDKSISKPATQKDTVEEKPKDYSNPIRIGSKTLSDIENNMQRIGKPPKGAIFKNDEKTYTVTKIGKKQPDGISVITFEVDNGNKKSEMRVNYYGDPSVKKEKKEEPIVERISFKAKGQDDQFHKYKKTALEFKLKESITKTHFKELMRLSYMYDPKTKIGYISESDKDKFMELVDKMNRSNLKRARTSHARSIEKRKQKASQRMSFNEWYEEADMPEKVNGEWIDRETGLPWKD